MIVARHSFVKGLSQSLRTRCGVKSGWRLLAAVSGGADSMAMLHGLNVLRDRREWRLDVQVAHIQHHLRPEAEDEAAWVAQTCRQMGLVSHRRDIQPLNEFPSDRNATGGTANLEGNARRLRYAALIDIAKENDVDAIATAHHADDQLETLIMRLIRGASLRGMRGIGAQLRMQRQRIIRPMLFTDHAGAIAFLKDIEQTWQEDASNRNTTLIRNRIRAEILPVLRAIRHDAAMKAVDSAQVITEVAAWTGRQVQRLANRRVEVSGDDRRIERQSARRMKPVLLAMLLRDQCVLMGCPTDQLPARQIQAMVRATKQSDGEVRQWELGGGVRVVVDRHEVKITRLTGPTTQ